MNCNCGNWDDASPCTIHGDKKLPRPEVCWHTNYMVNVARRSSNLKWFYTVSKDSIRTFESRDFDSKSEILKLFQDGIYL